MFLSTCALSLYGVKNSYVLYGPFSMDLVKFIDHMQAYRRSHELVSLESFRWFLLHRESIQVGQDAHPLRVLGTAGRLNAIFRI